MKKEWALSNNKALINFSQNYCDTEEKVLSCEGFRSVLEHFFVQSEKRYDRNRRLLTNYLNVNTIDEEIEVITKISKLLTIMDSEEISKMFPEYEVIYTHKKEFRRLFEDIYTYWRSLERYAIVHAGSVNSGLVNTSFIDSKEKFDRLILGLYRKITNNLSMTTPTVYRQVAAGTNAGMVLYDAVWPIPDGYEILSGIPFVKEVVLQSPFITYPKKNKRDGFFEECPVNPLSKCRINPDHYFCFPVKVGDLLAYSFVNRDFLTHGVSLSNLFEIPSVSEISGRRPDLMVIFGAEDHHGEVVSEFYDDRDNSMLVGYVSYAEKHDYFGYMKKMLLTLHNIHQIKNGNLPIHGAMVNIMLKDGTKANVTIVGDSGAGKSESIEAFRGLADEHISNLNIIFDDMGTFRIEEDGVMGYGTEVGAFVRLDDLETGYAFKELDRSVFMNPDKINARLITPVATYEEIMKGQVVDILLYANNYDEVKEGETAISRFENAQDAVKVFKAGKRFAKGTTTEKGLTESFFANPFGPHQKQDETSVLMDKYFSKLFEKGVFVGELKTQLGVSGVEKDGPQKAALDLFDVIKKINKK